MATNPTRRALLADAGLRVLAHAGARGLTHRAVDAEAHVPTGTCSNYFASRDELLAALAERALERIGPSPERLTELQARTPGLDLLVEYTQYIVERTIGAPELTMALFELRLEASRRTTLTPALSRTLRSAYQHDVAFTAERGLPAGAIEIALLHYAIDGLLLDQLTVPIDPDLDPSEITRLLVTRLTGC